MMEQEWGAQRIKELRTKLKVSQQSFAALIGFTVTAVNRWENDKGSPTGLAELLLALLSNVVDVHPRIIVLRVLRGVGPEPVPLVRALVWLERHPSRPPHPVPALGDAPPFTFGNSPPPSSMRPPPFAPGLLRPDSTP